VYAQARDKPRQPCSQRDFALGFECSSLRLLLAREIARFDFLLARDTARFDTLRRAPCTLAASPNSSFATFARS
jgi:hypothetical protein